MNSLIEQILTHCASALDSVKPHRLKIRFYNDMQQFQNAIDTASCVLDKLGDAMLLTQFHDSSVPSNMIELTSAVAGMTNKEILGKDEMKDEASISKMKISHEITTMVSLATHVCFLW